MIIGIRNVKYCIKDNKLIFVCVFLSLIIRQFPHVIHNIYVILEKNKNILSIYVNYTMLGTKIIERELLPGSWRESEGERKPWSIK
jgi:hypothetical protein